MSRWVAVSGCSGGGKSSVVAALEARGYAAVREPGRAIVQEELRTGGGALPWVDGVAFARRCLDRAERDLAHRSPGTWTFFDRGLVDAAVALRDLTGDAACTQAQLQVFHRAVFLVPPWPALFENDDERRLDFDTAVAEYDRLLAAYTDLHYDVVVLPRVGVDERADLILREVGKLDA